MKDLKGLLWNKTCNKNRKRKKPVELLNASFQGIKRLFVLSYFIADSGNDEAGIKDSSKYFLPRGEIKYYNVLIDGRNFFDEPFNDIIKQYDEVKKVSTGYGDGYTTGCLLDYSANSISRSCWRRW